MSGLLTLRTLGAGWRESPRKLTLKIRVSHFPTGAAVQSPSGRTLQSVSGEDRVSPEKGAGPVRQDLRVTVKSWATHDATLSHQKILGKGRGVYFPHVTPTGALRPPEDMIERLDACPV